METIRGLNSNGPAIIGTGVVFTVLAIATVGLRFASKRIAGAPYRADDWFLLSALIVYFVAEILVIESDVIGRKATSEDDPQYITYQKYVYVYSVFYFVVIALVEVSILLLYRHVFYPTHLRYTSIILAAICAAWLIAALVIEIGYPGHPISLYFPGSSSVVFNVTYLPFWLAMSIIETLIEIIILVLPIREIYHLQLSRQKKILLSLILSLGGFVVLTGVVRMAVLYRPGEVDFDLTQGDIWLNVHLGTAIISACLPTFRPLIPRSSGGTSRYHSRQGSYSINHSTALSAAKKRIRGDNLGESREGIVLEPQKDLQGTFADARHSESSATASTRGQEDGAIRAGEATGVKRTVEVL